MIASPMLRLIAGFLIFLISGPFAHAIVTGCPELSVKIVRCYCNGQWWYTAEFVCSGITGTGCTWGPDQAECGDGCFLIEATAADCSEAPKPARTARRVGTYIDDKALLTREVPFRQSLSQGTCSGNLRAIEDWVGTHPFRSSSVANPS